MKKRKNGVWGIWSHCLCTFNSFDIVLLLVLSTREITRELTILEGQPPSVLEQLDFTWNHFHFQAKIGKPKKELFGVAKCLVIQRFLLWVVF